MKTLVMKFGGASVATSSHFAMIAKKIIEAKKSYQNIVVVVSAMANETEALIKLAHEVNPSPPRREMDMLVSVGERISISLLAMALDVQGEKAISFTGSQSGIITCGRHFDARIVEVKPRRVLENLEKGLIVIVAGFQGVSRAGEITTLGRGGSDTTAVALAIALNADKVLFFKDVAGIYDHDPKVDPQARFYSSLTYSDALEIVLKGAKVLHPRSIALAKKNHMPLHVCSFNDVEESCKQGTMIGVYPKGNESIAIYEEALEYVTA